LPQDDLQAGDPFLHAHVVRQLLRVNQRSKNKSDVARIQQRLDSIELPVSSEDVSEGRNLLDAYQQFVVLKTKVGDHTSSVLHSRTMAELADALHDAKAISTSLHAFAIGAQGTSSLAAGDYEFGRQCFQRMQELDDNVLVTSTAVIYLAMCAEGRADAEDARRLWNQVAVSFAADDSTNPIRQWLELRTQHWDKVLQVLTTLTDDTRINKLDWETSMAVVVAASRQENHQLVDTLIERMANTNPANEAAKYCDIAACLSRAAEAIEQGPGKLSDVKRKELVQQYSESAVEMMGLAIRSGFCRWHFLSSDPNLKQVRKTTWYSGRQRRSTVNSIGISLALVPAGRFVQGSKLSPTEITQIFPFEKNEALFAREQPKRTVEISKPFFMGATEVTVEQFRQFVEDHKYVTDAERQVGGGGTFNPSVKGSTSTKDARTWKSGGSSGELPVVFVSWNDANESCKWLSEKDGAKYRLPTEAEWEYACRAGTTTLYSTGDDPESLAESANIPDAAFRSARPSVPYSTIKGNDGFEMRSPAGLFRPNAFGLHDMHGNVWEWCSDAYMENYYESGETVDPIGPDPETLATYSIVVAGKPLTPEQMQESKLDNYGFGISFVGPGSAAAAAGLTKGDILLSVGNQNIANLSGLKKAVQDSKGKTIQIRYLRDTKEFLTKVTPNKIVNRVNRGACYK
jgi:formylglycine-generating enzyme required for sulfatase activity